MSEKMFGEATWFTEKCPAHGSAFSLKITGKLHEEQTPFQRIEIYATEKFGHLMVLDGCTMVSQYENFLYHEMISHPALFTHPAPKRIVIIGGGDCGTLREVLKHSTVEEVWQFDIDEAVTRLSEKYFPELCESNHDPRARIEFADGVQWISHAENQSIDIIIVDATDPIGPAEGLFTEDFFKHCYRALKSDGLLVQQTESPLYHQTLIEDTHAAMQRAGFSHTQLLSFPQPIYPSGWWSVTMASASLTLKNFREKEACDKTFTTRYYNAAIHHAALALPEFMRRNN